MPSTRPQTMRARSSMNLKTSSLAVLAVALTASLATADETAWPTNSAGEISVFATVLRFQIYADHCSARVPELKPKFESLMEDMNRRIHGLSKGLIASEEFKDMQDAAVPVEIVEALDDSFHDGRHNLERQDAATVCPKKLQDFGAMNDESLQEGLTANLKAVRNMMRKLGHRGALHDRNNSTG